MTVVPILRRIGAVSRHAISLDRLVRAVETAPFFSRAEIQGWQQPVSPSPDWLWDALMLSFSTWGSSRGSLAFDDPEFTAALKYDAVSSIPTDERQGYLQHWFEQGGWRYPRDKASHAAENLARIERSGGVRSMTQEALAQPGRDAKIRFVSQFRGIGPKYARNLWMDIRHPDFLGSIAVDARIRKVAKELGIDDLSYEELERFLQSAASRLGITPFGLDRFLYRNDATFLEWLRNIPGEVLPLDSSRSMDNVVWVVTVDGKPAAVLRTSAQAQRWAAKHAGTSWRVEVLSDED
jgi:hypothetical protein